MRTTIVLTDELAEQAKALEINVSEVTREALARRVEAAEALARVPGEGWETVTATYLVDVDGQEELRQFTGKRIAEGWSETWEEETVYYLTPKGNIVSVSAHGYVDESGPYDGGLFEGTVRQRAEELMGEIPTPKVWDI